MTTSGWGLGEWNDMAWGTGVDYVYNPTVFLDAEGILAYLSGQGSLSAFAATNIAPVLAATGTLRTSLSAPAGSLVAFGASGPLLTYTATGVIEDGD
jgi:hypothetical protein